MLGNERSEWTGKSRPLRSKKGDEKFMLGNERSEWTGKSRPLRSKSKNSFF